mgnify:CR=1 FL=1
MTGYTKLFSSILMSSIWEESTETRIVWVTLLALVDQHGHVDATVKSLARVARVSAASCQRAIDTFLAPDPADRSGVEDGRRLRVELGGWGLVNFALYRYRMSVDERREQDKLRKRALRAKPGVRTSPQASTATVDVSIQVVDTTHDPVDQASASVLIGPHTSENVRTFQQAEAEAEAEADQKIIRTSEGSVRETPPMDEWFERLKSLYPAPRVTTGHRTMTAFVDALLKAPEGSEAAFGRMLSNLAMAKNSHQWRVKGMIPRLEKWLMSEWEQVLPDEASTGADDRGHVPPCRTMAECRDKALAESRASRRPTWVQEGER